MKNFRGPPLLVALLLTCLLCGGNSANANVSVNLHLGFFPELVPVPGHPVYYAPGVSANFFFYDNAYWLFEDGRWFTSDWYDGPWQYVDPYYVPAFVLRVPVRYYRAPPPWFRGWHYHAPPRWGHHWGPHWSQRRHGWDYWDRHHPPARAPLPHYRHGYSDRHRDGRPQWEQHRSHNPHRNDHDRNGYRNDHRGEHHKDYRNDHRDRKEWSQRNEHRERQERREHSEWRDRYQQPKYREQPRNREQRPHREQGHEQRRTEQFRHGVQPRPDHRVQQQQRPSRQNDTPRRGDHQQRPGGRN